jgi:hypothetical protein
MKTRLALAVLLTVLLSACVTAKNSLYQSSAPEVRGERAITSNIELVSEVDLTGSVLGVFYAKEVYLNGDAQTLLFTRRFQAALSNKAGSIVDYDLSATSSLSVLQGQKFLSAIEEYLAKDPKSLQASQMFNYELYSGIIDMSAGSDRYRPFKDVTFAVACSVTSSGKTFKTIFPVTTANLYGIRSTSYDTLELEPAQVQKLHDAIKAALAKSTPELPTATSGAG